MREITEIIDLLHPKVGNSKGKNNCKTNCTDRNKSSPIFSPRNSKRNKYTAALTLE